MKKTSSLLAKKGQRRMIFLPPFFFFVLFLFKTRILNLKIQVRKRTKEKEKNSPSVLPLSLLQLDELNIPRGCLTERANATSYVFPLSLKSHTLQTQLNLSKFYTARKSQEQTEFKEQGRSWHTKTCTYDIQYAGVFFSPRTTHTNSKITG